MSETVVVVGASPKAERYSNRAVLKLSEHGHRVLPVHPACEAIHGHVCYKNLQEVAEIVNTVTLYVGPHKSTQLQADILALNPQRLIMNPGAENDALAEVAEAQGIEVVKGCTLVMLQTGQF